VIKFVSLLSGGLDSPIAAYLMIQRGFQPVFISFLTSDDLRHSMKKKVTKISQQLKIITNLHFKIYFINHDPNLIIFQKECERKLTCILCKRLMFRIASEIAKIEKTNLIVTGDILGEQASQTLDNLISYNDIIENFIILRPLIGWDKIEVIDLNKRLGLFEISSQKSASCQYNPKYPETHARQKNIEFSEININIQKLVKNSIKSAEILEF
jgi:thiamine biosynthesis protein ThiI